MTTPPDELIKYFSDGMLPTGENFAALITSMVHQDDFQRQVHRFEDWISQPELSLGTDAGSWRIYADPENKLRIARGTPDPEDRSATDIRLDGWIGMPGRVGASIAPDAFAAPQAEIGLALFAKVPSDGGWHPIAEMPGRPCAFEITAATTREVVSAKPTFMSALRWLAGMRKAQNGVLHTVVTATGGNHKPRLQVSADPEVAAAMHRLRLVLLVFLVVLLGLFLQIDLQSRVSPDTSAGYVVAESIQGMRDFATWSGMVNVYVLATKAWAIRVNALPGVLVYPLYTAALAGLLFGLRCAVAVWSAGHQSLRLKWVPAGGSLLQGNRKWTLCLSGPIFEKRGAADEHDICFHITKLWS